MLQFSYIEESTPGPSTIPERLPNGGLDTGKQASGPWGNYPVRPDPVDLSKNLLTEPLRVLQVCWPLVVRSG
jgi:hypothetical protein